MNDLKMVVGVKNQNQMKTLQILFFFRQYCNFYPILFSLSEKKTTSKYICR